MHQWSFLERIDVLGVAAPGATVLINSPYPPEEIWDRLPRRGAERSCSNAVCTCTRSTLPRSPRPPGSPAAVNTVMQTCFFALAGVLPTDEAIAKLKDAIATTYGKRGELVVQRNIAAVDTTLAQLLPGAGPATRSATAATAGRRYRRRHRLRPAGDGRASSPARAICCPSARCRPTGRSRPGRRCVEKRTIAAEIPIWEADLCIDCGKCAIVCPHAAIRLKVYDPAELAGDGVDVLKTKSFRSREVPGMSLTVQVAPDDCTGCGLCVTACPAHDKSEVKRKSINLRPIGEHLDTERVAWDAFLRLHETDTAQWDPASVKTSQLRRPLFEFSGACSGCGETPYLKLLTQLFGDHLLIANATGCSSIYGGNLPTTPYSTNDEGRGPAWSNSLFEDNAEFGLGMRLGLDAQQHAAVALLDRLAAPDARSARPGARRSGARRDRRRRRPADPRPARARRAAARRARGDRRSGRAGREGTLARARRHARAQDRVDRRR